MFGLWSSESLSGFYEDFVRIWYRLIRGATRVLEGFQAQGFQKVPFGLERLS